MNLERFPFFASRAAAWLPRAGAVLLLCAGPAAQAQTVAPPATDASNSSAAPAIVVTGNPLQRGDDDLLPAASVLSGERLVIRREATLGATLRDQPGVASSYFGPNADRPSIRGLDGERVRILSGGSASLDASALSYDHALPIDPVAVDRIEVLRGPAALLYGGNALGGVVNVIDGRIARAPADRPGASGTFEARAGASASRAMAARADYAGPTGLVNLHVDLFERQSGDVAIPGAQYTALRRAQALAQGQPAGGEGRIVNSALRADGGALGLSFTGAEGYLGLSSADYRSRYGTVAEPGSTIDMQQQLTRAEGQWRLPAGAPASSWLTSVRASAARTDYRHVERDEGQAKTRFANHGGELRLEAEHRPFAHGWRGVFGLQAEQARLSAVGDEAFVPRTRSRSRALFALEEARFGPWLLSLGARRERVEVSSAGQDAADTGDDRFGAAQSRRFDLTSAAAGVLADLGRAAGGRWSAGLQWAQTERAPSAAELFADGVHTATGSYEVGNPALGRERARSVELSLRYKGTAISSKLSLWRTRFDGYIGLFRRAGAGFERSSDEGETVALPIYDYAAVPARFSGAEWTLDWLAWQQGGQRLNLRLRADTLSATDLASGQPLPRIAPRRVGLGLDYATGALSAGLDVDHHARARVPAGEYQAAAYTLVNAQMAWRQGLPQLGLLWYARIDNLGNAEARPATSLLRELAPLPGRRLQAGVRLSF